MNSEYLDHTATSIPIIMSSPKRQKTDPKDQVSQPETGARKGYISWDQHFMEVAESAARRSKDPVTQVGACIVNSDMQIVGVGYNSMPYTADGRNDDKFTWQKKVKKGYVCHAELNAIVKKEPRSVNNCTIYVTLFPCNHCAQLIIQSGITKVIYLDDKHANKPDTICSKEMLDAAGIPYSHFKSQQIYDNINNFCNFKSFHLYILTQIELMSSEYLDHTATSIPIIMSSHEPETGARKDCISWDEHFMEVAELAARRSKDLSTQVGACIVNSDMQIVGVGYRFTWGEGMYVCHAELNAIVKKEPRSVNNCTIYVTSFPCNKCTQLIIQSGITKVIYLHDNFGTVSSKKMLDAANIPYNLFKNKH
ncbi:uncharacterized protein [Atheta coriaria]|uniref:uncharacterized protein n=1 Tax=Dalotia coriaria TaxID=877792 RepID=UPI0031F385EF